ncbi:MAG: ErfK/YbiS/YcfS/YnhG family protein [Frankiales bacterium]|nr:ErfK/YbiS/YcfS/YnhG family protein [Frankiales bacterium]
MLSAKRTTVVAGLLVAGLGLGGLVGYTVSHKSPSAVPASDAAPVPTPTLVPQGATSGVVPWNKPLAVAVSDGTLRAVTATDPDGQAVPGTLSSRGWTSASTLLPSSTYLLRATVVDNAGKTHQLQLRPRTTAPAHLLKAVLSPGDGNVVGVGMPVIITLNRAVNGHADRQAVVDSLSVTTTPAVTGGWRWMSPTELHYRGPSYWAAGTKISVHADFSRLHLSDGTWGSGVRNTSYSIGSAIISTVDVTKHVMTVTKDGKVLRVVKVSTGRDKYPTKGGVHLVLEKTKLKIMDSATVGIPRNSPDGYYEKVPDSVRISYGGAFVHSAGWSVRDQGVRNVSHGCVNISPTDAAWFFNLVKRGDVVNIVHAAVGPKLSDPGMSDWNVPFTSWANS